MQSWNTLPGTDFRAVADYVASIGQGGNLAADQRYAADDVLQKAGKRVFDTHCARCHGQDAAGDGPEAKNMLPRPANFHQMMPSYDAAAEILRNGVPGSAMPAWPLLNPAEVQAVTYYMRSFYSGSATTAHPRPASASMQMEGMQ